MSAFFQTWQRAARGSVGGADRAVGGGSVGTAALRHFLLGNREAPEVWGFVSLSNGARYDLTHWENMVGRMRSADAG